MRSPSPGPTPLRRPLVAPPGADTPEARLLALEEQRTRDHSTDELALLGRSHGQPLLFEFLFIPIIKHESVTCHPAAGELLGVASAAICKIFLDNATFMQDLLDNERKTNLYTIIFPD